MTQQEEKVYHRLQGLEGTGKEYVEAGFINSASEIAELLANGYACTSAGDDGAINIWKDQDGFIHCEAMRFCISKSKQKFLTLQAVEQWTESWLREINRL